MRDVEAHPDPDMIKMTEVDLLSRGKRLMTLPRLQLLEFHLVGHLLLPDLVISQRPTPTVHVGPLPTVPIVTLSPVSRI